VSAVVVTWNSLRWLPGCFGSLESQTIAPLAIVVVDNGSEDGSVEWIRAHCPNATIIENPANRGFCVANNQGIDASSGEYVLLVNTDVELAPDYVERLVAELAADPTIGSAAGKLLRGASEALAHQSPAAAANAREPRRIDSAGEVLYSTLRMVNRGAEEIDRGQYDLREEVFGVTAAAALYRRAMLDDVRIAGEFLDSDFFSYLEDSDLNWRARLRGWRSVYQPAAVADHIRQHATSRSLAIRRHAYANRYSTALRNASWLEILRALPQLVLYETHRLLRLLVREPRLLPAYGKVCRLLPRTLRKRREIQRRRRVSPRALREWMRGEDWLGEFAKRCFGRRSGERRSGSECARTAATPAADRGLPGASDASSRSTAGASRTLAERGHSSASRATESIAAVE